MARSGSPAQPYRTPHSIAALVEALGRADVDPAVVAGLRADLSAGRLAGEVEVALWVLAFGVPEGEPGPARLGPAGSHGRAA